uniref:Uncharacterized protein n=1 Tax=Lepeophtheirus salmonis TaxID=72036 RepID=A0A0K2U1C0_LEPSM
MIDLIGFSIKGSSCIPIKDFIPAKLLYVNIVTKALFLGDSLIKRIDFTLLFNRPK